MTDNTLLEKGLSQDPEPKNESPAIPAESATTVPIIQAEI